MRRADAVAVDIFNDLKGHFLASGREYGLAGTIVGLFFHDLMVHFTGILIHRDAKNEYGNDFTFPFVNQTYAKQPFGILEFQTETSKSKFLVTRIKRTPLLSFGVGESIPMSVGRDKVEKMLLSVLGCTYGTSQAYLMRRREQLKYLFDVIDEICRNYSINNRDQIIRNWSRYAELHTTDEQRLISQKSVILGTRCQLHNRKLSVNYLQQEKEVIGMTHGEVSNAVFDEPIFGYADCSYCTTLIDYGTSRSFGTFNSPLIEPRRVIYRTSASIQKIEHESDVIEDLPIQSKRLLYIPTMYSANKLYGPFRNLEDDIYKTWQEVILNIFPDITVKIHPKSLAGWGYKSKTESRGLIDCILEYEGIILDYCSTAATLAFSTNKPIVYFDLGLRNLTPEYKEDIRQRCHYIKVHNAFDSGDIREEILYKLKNQERKKNSQMRKYSVFDGDKESILSNIYRLIKKM